MHYGVPGHDYCPLGQGGCSPEVDYAQHWCVTLHDIPHGKRRSEEKVEEALVAAVGGEISRACVPRMGDGDPWTVCRLFLDDDTSPLIVSGWFPGNSCLGEMGDGREIVSRCRFA